MVVILLEAIAIHKIIVSIKNKGVNLSAIFTLAFFLQTIILISYRIELDAIGREVYYSDAEVYWNHTKLLLDGQRIIGYGTQVGYAYFCWLIQLLSPFRSVVWNNVSNIMLINLSVLLVDSIFVETNMPAHNIRQFTRICIYNPLVIYSLGRNLKDSLFLFITLLIIFLYMHIKNDKKWAYIIPIIALTVAVSTIRPWGFLVMPLLAIDGIISSEIGNRTKRMFLALGIATVFIIIIRFTSLWRHVILWEPIVLEHAGSLSFREMIRAPIKIITGPGPYRALLGAKYFLFSTSTGNVFSAIGAILWWIALSSYGENIRAFHFKAQNTTFLLVCAMFIAIYSMQYGGSLELRFRGVIYILFSAAFFNGLRDSFRISANTVLIFLLILPVGTLLSA